MKKNLTIPNFLSLIRIVLIPYFIWAYQKENIVTAGIVLIASGLTDALDGFIARRFHQVSELGKVLDPIADKLTQFAIAVCLCTRYRAVIPLLVILCVKELFMLALGIYMIRQKKPPFGAKWWGKAATIIFYVGTIAIVLFARLLPHPAKMVTGISVVASVALIYSMIRYLAVYRECLQSKNVNSSSKETVQKDSSASLQTEMKQS